jgi:hypothetical protein
VPVPEQVQVRVVLGQDVEAGVGHDGWQRVERPQDLRDGIRHRAAPGADRHRHRFGEHVHVPPLGAVKPERARERVEHLGAHVDLPALLKPRVPGDAHAGEQRQLLAPQAGRAPP